jgi:RecB family exonuclease
MSQTTLEGMPTALFTCSPSKLLTWLDCPRRFRIQYIEKRSSGFPWAHNSMGTSAHVALRNWFDLSPHERSPERGAQLVASVWVDDGYRDDAQSAAWRARVSEMVRSYLEGVDPEIEPIARERSVAFMTERLSISGKVDRVDVEFDDDGEHAVIIDYKTTKQVLTDDDARTSLALALYVLGVRRTLKRRCTRVELHHLPSGRILTHEHDQDSLTRHLGRAESIGREAAQAQAAFKPHEAGVRNGEVQAVEAADELFPARPGPLCGWCDMHRWCSVGQAHAEQKKPWDGLAQEVTELAP